MTMRPVALALVLGLLLAGCTSATESGLEAQSSSSPSPAASAPGSGTTGSVAGEPDDWRPEVWRDVQLEVPAAWALGYAPVVWRGGPLQCGVGPLESRGRTRGPYVGRPGSGSDLCLRTELTELGLDRPGVWFGSPLPVGDAIAKNGLHQVTVEVGDSRVTVASRDEGILTHVLDSVEVVREDANGCPARPRPSDAMSFEGYGDPTHLSVCLYDDGEDDGTRGLEREWSDRMSGRAARALLAAVEAGADRACPARCLPPCPPADQLVLLRVHGEDMYGADIPRDFLVTLGTCPTLEVAVDGSVLRLTRALVEPWASAGVATYVLDPSGRPGLTPYFRPLWG